MFYDKKTFPRLVLALGIGLLLAGILAAQTREWKLRVSAETAVVRLNPDSSSPSVGTLPKGTALSSYEAEGSWFRIVVPPGKDGITIIGYIGTSDVEILEEKVREPVDFWAQEAGVFKGFGLTIRILAGQAFLGAGDVPPAARGLFDSRADGLSAEGYEIVDRRIDPLRKGVAVSTEVMYRLGPRLDAGLGLDYGRIFHDDTLQYTERGIYQNTMDSVSISRATGLKLIAAYTIPLARVLSARLTAGPALFLGHYEYSRAVPTMTFEEKYAIISDVVAPGACGALALELRISPRASFLVEASGRYAKVSGPEASQLNWRSVPGGFDVREDVEGTLYFLPESPHPRLAVFADGQAPEGWRKGVLDFSGLDVKGGFLIRF